jgi:hypothetical protein
MNFDANVYSLLIVLAILASVFLVGYLVYSWASGVWSSAGNGLSSAWNSVSGAVSGAYDSATSAVGNAYSSATAGASTGLDSFEAGVAGDFQAWSNALSTGDFSGVLQ